MAARRTNISCAASTSTMALILRRLSMACKSTCGHSVMTQVIALNSIIPELVPVQDLRIITPS